MRGGYISSGELIKNIYRGKPGALFLKILIISYLSFPFYVNFCGHQTVSVSPLSFEAFILHIF